MNNYTDLNKKSITICQKLIPLGKTRENINKFNAMENDEFVKQNKGEVKRLIKAVAREHIDSSLIKVSKTIDFSKMFELMEKAENKETRKEVLGELFAERIELSKIMGKELSSKKFNSAATLTKMVPEYLKNHKSEESNKELIENVKNRQSIFNKYEDTIDFALSPVLKQGTVVYRVLNENAYIFYDNLKRMENFDYFSLVKTEKLENKIITKTDEYKKLMLQSGIENYNYAINIINKNLNEYCQKNKINYSKLKLNELNKMILSETTSFYEEIDDFKTDDEVIMAYNKFADEFNSTNFNELFKTVRDTDKSSLIIKGNLLSAYSINVYGNYKIVPEYVRMHFDETYVQKKSKDSDKEYKKYLDKGLSVENIHFIINTLKKDTEISEYHLMEKIGTLLDTKLDECEKERISLKSDDSYASEIIKNNYDYVIKIKRLLKLFDTESSDFDAKAASSIDSVLEILEPVQKLYNMTRNYISSKPTSKKKMTLTFDTSSFGGGWSESVESSKRVFLMKNDNGDKFFGIYNMVGCKYNNTTVTSIARDIKEQLMDKKPNGEYYRKLIYSSTADVGKMIPKLFINPNLDEDNLKRFKAGEHKTNKEFLDYIIDVVKKAIASHRTWSTYNFKYKDNYESYNDFCDDIQSQGYMTNWKYIDKDYVDSLVESGCIYLFKIYNNDYSKAKKKGGKKKTHTQYLDYLFSDENEKTKLIKLLGGAEVFFREPQIEKPYVHKAGSVLLNKVDKNGNKVTDYKNRLIDAQKVRPDDIYTSVKTYDIIKNKRYTKEQFELHFPISIGSESNPVSFKELTKDMLNTTKSTIVITRSRNHLLYLTVFNEIGDILESKSLNTVNGTDYKERLQLIEKQKKENASNWKTIGSNANLLDGYISYAIKDISDLVLKYEAIVVLESKSISKDKNLLDERAYTKFKTALFKKLEFLIDKTKEDNEPGGLLHPYNLTRVGNRVTSNIIETASNGIVVQVPPYYKAVTDPLSYKNNFVQLAKLYATNNTERKELVSKFHSFFFDGTNFVLEYNTETFKPEISNKFMCSSKGERILYIDKKKTKVNLTEYIKDELNFAGLSYMENENILENADLKDKYIINALYNSIRGILQMYNYSDEEAFFVSPVSILYLDGNDCLEILSCINLLQRSYMIINKVLNDEKPYISFKEMYS